MIGKVNVACPKYMILINIGYLSSQIQQLKLKGNFKNGRFPLTSMLTSRHLILCDIVKKILMFCNDWKGK